MNVVTYPSKSLDVACSYEDSKPQRGSIALRRRCNPSLLLIAILCSPAHLIVEAQVLRLHAVQRADSPYGKRLSTLFKMPTGDLWALIDTGSPSTYFLWKDWFEEEYGEEACTFPGIGCYTCPTPCQPHNPFWITYLKGPSVRVFLYRGTVPLSSVNVSDLQFGLACGQQPPEELCQSVLGLRFHPEVFGRIPILQQLVSRSPKVIGAKVFALYLSQTPQEYAHYGELLLGGGDRRLYKRDLRYVRFDDSSKYIVKLSSIQIGEATRTRRENVDLYIDTGTNAFLLDQRRYDILIESVKREAARSGVTVTWNDILTRWTANCTHLDALPLVRFWLGTEDVPLNLTPRSYVHTSRDICYINVEPFPTCVLPVQALVGNYFEFRPDEGQIGFGEAVS